MHARCEGASECNHIIITGESESTEEEKGNTAGSLSSAVSVGGDSVPLWIYSFMSYPRGQRNNNKNKRERVINKLEN